ncbi:uncharacterized protein LOC131323292 [Rhododendron vialii]|uniref:uncharacterized protein LOC131323292 n=1 Tax=Rhododendron vialii TaxID=182163 RepID=UPI00265E7B47|nr:uncharacterized protein LOC131323292 [Rhododendron vialii]
MIWHPSPNGSFSVKSAYRLAREGTDICGNIHMGQTSSFGVLPTVWKKLWGLQIHPKVKLFMWKCLNNVLTTNVALFARKFRFDPVCSRCGKAEESISHVLFRCEVAIKVWIHSPFRLRPEELLDCRNMTDWWDCIQERINQSHMPPFSLGMALLYCWWIWRARNDFIVNGKCWATEAVSGKAQGDFFEFKDANSKVPSPLSRSTRNGTLVWQCPGMNVTKINVDAAVSRSSNSIGTGTMARGNDGKVLGIFLSIHTSITSSRIAEAMAIRDGLKLGIDLNLSKVVIESDAEAIVRKCSTSLDPPIDIAAIIFDCLALKESFSSCEFDFVKHDCNRVAQCCAQKALLNGWSGMWTSILPPWGSQLSDV